MHAAAKEIQPRSAHSLLCFARFVFIKLDGLRNRRKGTRQHKFFFIEVPAICLRMNFYDTTLFLP